MSTNLKQDNVKIISLAAPRAIASIIESMGAPVISSQISITESDANAMIDNLAKAVKFKNIDGDQDNSFYEGSDDKEIKLDDNGNYVGKGKTTIFNKDVDLKDPEKSTEQWMETPTGKVSDAVTEEVPNPQGFNNLNENEAMDFSDDNANASIGETQSDDDKHKGPNIDDHKNMKSPLNHPQPHDQKIKTNNAIKNLFANVK